MDNHSKPEGGSRFPVTNYKDQTTCLHNQHFPYYNFGHTTPHNTDQNTIQSHNKLDASQKLFIAKTIVLSVSINKSHFNTRNLFLFLFTIRKLVTANIAMLFFHLYEITLLNRRYNYF